MKKLFVPEHIALLAKEKGFDVPCFGYFKHGTISSISEHPFSMFNYNQEPSEDEDDDDDISLLSAPLYQQLIDWFIEKHGIHITPFLTNEKTFSFVYRYKIQYWKKNKNGDLCWSKKIYTKLDTALEEAFKLKAINYKL